MPSLPSPYIFVALALAIYIVYRLLLPRPISGIPYHDASARHILGDLPLLGKHERETGEKLSWFASHARKINSPIFQVFANPLTKPWVVLTDFREGQDIMLRRTKEFDRSEHFSNIFLGLVPDHHISMKSSNPQFKAHRRLIQDLMTPAFLNEVSAPRIYESFTSLMSLWIEKARLANGHPFSASEDVYNAALDAIWTVTFPLDAGDTIMKSQWKQVVEMQSLDGDLPINRDIPATFPEMDVPVGAKAVLTLTESVGYVVISPLPKFTFWVLSQLPYMRKAHAAKENMISDALEKARSRMTSGSQDSDEIPRCALDDILRRELMAAKKEEREPVYKTRAIYDELFGLLVAGHDTTSTTMNWGLKLLSDHQDAQRKLRDALRAAFPSAVAEGRLPTAKEITKSRIPYLDATQEEIIRKATTTSGLMREATADTVVLGHRIPKGTTVLILVNGPDIVEPPIGSIPETLRSESCQATKERAKWNTSDLHLFKPERWLQVKDGEEVFDSTSAPLLTFGLGPRGCFGRRMAYLELKIMFVLLFWNFELQNTPEDLSSYQGVDNLTHQPRQCYARLLHSPIAGHKE